ncbi:MAG TPA: response regulator [Vicinamibacterales bacterium]|jgi:DNA-binding response OmpR family regulator|nr:response regulator [Vicinamibacterales bacterium]
MPRLVLLIDRDDDTREMYAEFFKSLGVELVEAADGRDGLAQAISRNPEVIVTDTRLPGIDGYELCTLLRRDSTTRATPIVVVTGDGYEADIARARAAGADSVLVKPCLPQALFAEIHTLVQQAREARTPVLPLLADNEAAQPSSSVPTPRRGVQAKALSRTFHRHDTTKPPTAPPDLVCPACDRRLVYQRSHIGGVSERHAEQWDDYECLAGCGVFQYRQRTRTLRKVS